MSLFLHSEMLSHDPHYFISFYKLKESLKLACQKHRIVDHILSPFLLLALGTEWTKSGWICAKLYCSGCAQGVSEYEQPAAHLQSKYNSMITCLTSSRCSICASVRHLILTCMYGYCLKIDIVHRWTLSRVQISQKSLAISVVLNTFKDFCRTSTETPSTAHFTASTWVSKQKDRMSICVTEDLPVIFCEILYNTQKFNWFAFPPVHPHKCTTLGVWKRRRTIFIS